MKYTKPPLSIPQQVRQLQDRGMIGDADLMAERLSVVSYYRLTAYWHPFRRRDRIAPQSHWPTRVHDLLRRFPHMPADQMGFPRHWLDCPVWASLKTGGSS